MATQLTWRQRLRLARFFRGLGPEPGPVTLDRNRVYILPTRHGLLLALVIGAIFIGGVNYDNSLAFMLAFLLGGLALIAILHTYRNLAGLVIEAGRCLPVFAGEIARFQLGIRNDTAVPRLAVGLAPEGEAAMVVDLVPGMNWVELPRPAQRRGRQQLGRVTVATRFPLGLFRAWSPFELAMGCLVYPAPAPQRGLPRPQWGSGGNVGDQGRGDDDFAALRPYHAGDSLRHVHWKAVAREQGLQTKQFGGHQLEELWLSWELAGGVPVEARLERLCRWVLEADAAGIAYGVVLPDFRLPPAHGAAQRRAALEALALFGERP